MLQMLPAVYSTSWNPSERGVRPGNMDFKWPQLSALKSKTLQLQLQFGYEHLQKGGPTISGTFFCANQRPRQHPNFKKPGAFPQNVDKRKMKPYPIPIKKMKQAARDDKNLAEMDIEKPYLKKPGALPQNVDLPPKQPKRKKKPYPIPIKKIKQAARDDKKLAEMGIEKPLEPPKNGLLVPDLIPVAYEVLDAWKVLIGGLAQLLHVIPVYGCSDCSEVHVAQTGHCIQDCKGPTSVKRRSLHSWVKGSINDILLPIESYHLYDPFGRRIKHETRFDYDRIPAVVELCIQAGVDMPEYPSRRRTNPIRMIGKKVIDRGGFVEEPKPWRSRGSAALLDLDTHGACGRFPPPPSAELPRIAQKTIDAYEIVRLGVIRLMRKYSVKACGYCSEVHVGPWGHDAKLCGEFKHQWRDGKHGWQDAILDEVLPPNYVWHAQDPKGPPLTGALKRFYGKAPAVVEMCMQAGAQIPDKYKPMMRLDIIVPESEEARLVA